MPRISRRIKWIMAIIGCVAALSVVRVQFHPIAFTIGVTNPFAHHYDWNIDYGVSAHYSGQVWVFWRIEPINPELVIHHHRCIYP